MSRNFVIFSCTEFRISPKKTHTKALDVQTRPGAGAVQALSVDTSQKGSTGLCNKCRHVQVQLRPLWCRHLQEPAVGLVYTTETCAAPGRVCKSGVFLLLDVSILKGPELHLDVFTLRTGDCAASGLVYKTEACSALERINKTGA
jgi:hypothetical protein